MDKWQTQNAFWNSFGLPAYDEQTYFTQRRSAEETLPAYPHITYQSFGGRLGEVATLSASLWYRSETWAEIKQKSDEIARYIGEHTPLSIGMDNGYLWIKLPDPAPFAQPMASGSDDELIKRLVLTVEAECLAKY